MHYRTWRDKNRRMIARLCRAFFMHCTFKCGQCGDTYVITWLPGYVGLFSCTFFYFFFNSRSCHYIQMIARLCRAFFMHKQKQKVEGLSCIAKKWLPGYVGLFSCTNDEDGTDWDVESWIAEITEWLPGYVGLFSCTYSTNSLWIYLHDARGCLIARLCRAFFMHIVPLEYFFVPIKLQTSS